jgi:hypothetical protein
VTKNESCTGVYPNVSEIKNKNDNKHSVRSNAKGYCGKTHYTGSKNSNTTASSGRELYHLQFWLQVASPETFGYTLVYFKVNTQNNKNM